MRFRQVHLAVALVAAALASCALLYVSDTSGDAARRLVADGATLVDVRSPEEFADGHIDGALNIPVAQLERRLQEIPKGAPVVVYCRSGRRARDAAGVLRAAGYTEVHNLGPKSYWSDAP